MSLARICGVCLGKQNTLHGISWHPNGEKCCSNLRLYFSSLHQWSDLRTGLTAFWKLISVCLRTVMVSVFPSADSAPADLSRIMNGSGSAAPDSSAVCQPCSSDVSNSSPPLTPLGSTSSCPNKQLVCLHAKQIAPKSRYCFFWSTFMFISKIRDAAFFRQATLKFLLELLTPVSSLRNQLLPFFFPSMPEQHCKLHRCWNFPG